NGSVRMEAETPVTAVTLWCFANPDNETSVTVVESFSVTPVTLVRAEGTFPPMERRGIARSRGARTVTRVTIVTTVTFWKFLLVTLLFVSLLGFGRSVTAVTVLRRFRLHLS